MTKICPICRREFADESNTCPHCGYKRADATQSFAPIENDILLDTEMAKPQTQSSLYIARGPQTGTLIPLKIKKLTIGRTPHCDILLNDMTVSREHALIQPDTIGGYRITDLDSFNGIWINQENVTSAHLNNGDVIQIGAFCLIYKESDQ